LAEFAAAGLLPADGRRAVCGFVRRLPNPLRRTGAAPFARISSYQPVRDIVRQEVPRAVTISRVAPEHESWTDTLWRPRIAIVDAATAVRAGLPLMLPGFAFVAGFRSGATVLAKQPAVDAVLFDPHAGDEAPAGASSRDTIAALVSAGYRVCVYTLDRRPHFLACCSRAGAHGLVLKCDPLDDLARCLRQVARGYRATSSSVALPPAAIGGHPVTLTGRQRQVLAGRARGEPFRRIARRLNISERTAHDHWSAIARAFADFLSTHSPADLERSLGLDPGPAPLAPDALPGAPGRGEKSLIYAAPGRRRATVPAAVP
jgi:DNA-binding NarL/FixJ family response regulator